jgi:hypothetical protein
MEVNAMALLRVAVDAGCDIWTDLPEGSVFENPRKSLQ